ncbi:SDR family oxidoreductase [Corallococcus carmarthensis]|uniref:SDR family NAD(P)-dependent oxidoreductase n=1 Tax=Corallococcus carmarthensis TaxID=2316728 RepID=A0A3A8KI66_9BACT|nr:SDR family oxidoreductase [Corallococcus carmarthensis]NOK15619.1 SDR family oxidoreductase [Corallococcus carmarthensis]RKH07908.1 SDR family NAD(P)-dependent oxidoreductase [Corallococcus carmarthensis]
MNWKPSDIPSQHGRLAVITGTGGLGLEDALALARAGSEVIIAGRNPRKGADAVAKVLAEVPTASVRFEQVDLASLTSVADFAARLRSQTDKLDLLINNAAVMTPPKHEQTADGFELQFGTNYLGHFALTAHLLPLLRKGTNARVITLSSVAARDGTMDFDDLQSQRGYAPMKAYGQSKLACLLFAFELQRRAEANQWGITSVAAHPGISRTDLLHNAPGRWSGVGIVRSLFWFLFQPASQGALPTLYAATSPDAKGGGYYGPDKLNETRGFPAPAKVPPRANEQATAQRLWRESEQLTRVAFG